MNVFRWLAERWPRAHLHAANWMSIIVFPIYSITFFIFCIFFRETSFLVDEDIQSSNKIIILTFQNHARAFMKRYRWGFMYQFLIIKPSSLIYNIITSRRPPGFAREIHFWGMINLKKSRANQASRVKWAQRADPTSTRPAASRSLPLSPPSLTPIRTKNVAHEVSGRIF